MEKLLSLHKNLSGKKKVNNPLFGMSRAVGHKAGQGNWTCLLIFLSRDAAAWRPSDGRLVEGTLSTGSELPPGLPTP